MGLFNLFRFGRPKIEGSAISSEEKLRIISEYFAALDKINRSGSTTDSIDELLALMDESVMYIHENYGARFNRKSWSKAFMRNMARGVYSNGPDDKIIVINTITGKNYAAVEYSHGKLQEDGSWKDDEPCLAVFGFSGDKIALVQEYW